MIPDYQSCMRPVLAHVADGALHRSRAVKEAMADHFELSPTERHAVLPSGRQRIIDSRVGWALTYLSQAGLISRPSRGHVRITAEGRSALQQHPERIDNHVLSTYPSFIAFIERRKEAEQGEATAPPVMLTAEPEAARGVHDESPAELAETPVELAERAEAANRAAVEGELLQAALTLSPTGFEELVIRLLSAMGYGGSGTRMGHLERTSATGDAGVDGIISQDPLGLDRIYVQAKRYAVDRPIGRPRIHEFAGALLGKQGDRGVYITTSRFTEGARIEADRINARIELIDGPRLAALMVEHGVGVQAEHSVTLYRLDEDFMDSL